MESTIKAIINSAEGNIPVTYHLIESQSKARGEKVKFRSLSILMDEHETKGEAFSFYKPISKILL